ncbi:hypothetical protein H0X09_00045 [Candidatus Saccharibacteria bacterium]|nr:hypothetical protein [Candidatus Saccharibacteria bacterium]
MFQKIKNKLLILSSALMFSVPTLVPVVAHAQGTGPIQGGLCKGAQELVIAEGEATCEDPNTSTGNFSDLLRRIVNILSVIIGVIAVIMIIFGGLRYITSGGDSTKVGNAKNTILYALIGLIIVALSQVIVRFVLSNTTSIAS